MCTTDIECLQRIATNTTQIKAFCYALAVALAVLVFVFVIQKVLNYTIGRA